MDRIKKFFNDISIKKAFMLYTLICLLIAAALSSIAINSATSIREEIRSSYSTGKQEVPFDNSIIIIDPHEYDISHTKQDEIVINICDFFQTWSIPIFFSLCIVGFGLLFYRNKLKKPIEILIDASQKISSNNLDFNIAYNNNDEMGQLCNSFEKMRTTLYENNHKMWDMMNERKRINAIFAHDLRNPLTVLKGYTDFLNIYIPQGKVSEEKLISTLLTISNHIERLESYVATMNKIQKLDDILVEPKSVSVLDFIEQLNCSAKILVKDYSIEVLTECNITDEKIKIDDKIVTEVFENLISNAVRYANKKITISYSILSSILYIIISDDGKGFSKEGLHEATKPFYKDAEKNDLHHFGLGLNICSVLCEKHGGYLSINNNKIGGAKVTAAFLIEVDK